MFEYYGIGMYFLRIVGKVVLFGGHGVHVGGGGGGLRRDDAG